MSAPDLRPFRLADDAVRQRACDAIMAAPAGWVVRITPPGRTLDQNAAFHAIVADIAKAKPEWAGRAMSEDDWKALLVVSHAIATKGEGDIRLVPNLEDGGFVQLRESTARMSKARSTSLIDYTTSWAVSHGIRLRDPR